MGRKKLTKTFNSVPQIAWRTRPSPKPKTYREGDAKEIGIFEPTWPDLLTQRAWSNEERDKKISEAFKWYGYTCNIKNSQSWVVQFLESTSRHNDLLNQVQNNWVNIPISFGWLLRMGRMGLELKFSELRRMVEKMHECGTVDPNRTPIRQPKPNRAAIDIQSKIRDKVRECRAEIESRFENFITIDDYRSECQIADILVKYNIPAAKSIDVAKNWINLNTELETAIAGTDSFISESYDIYTRRQLKSMAKWVNSAVQTIEQFGRTKRSNRKPRRKPQTPAKIVSKLKFMKQSTELNIKSIDPELILKSNELWIFDTKYNMLCHYKTPEGVNGLHVRNSNIEGYDETISARKKLRKPKEQLAQLLVAGNALQTNKWFESIKSKAYPCRPRTNNEILLVKVTK